MAAKAASARDRCTPAWTRSSRDQCAAADIPFFFKQHGEWVEALSSGDQPGLTRPPRAVRVVKRSEADEQQFTTGDVLMRRVGKITLAGCLITVC
ncbi:DUF5131 family protein [Paraburkholderia fungorum]|uniref:DUF5131 family protein n=1 Tax=Paraburkholderia fungorum TaxID=134537 RepID=UPI0009434B55